MAAFQAWTLDKSQQPGRPPGSPRRPDAVPSGRCWKALADGPSEKHGGDVEKSLAAVPSDRSARASLAALGEPEIEATLARVMPGSRTARPPTRDDR